MTTAIEYIKGDATRPNATGNKIIVHICNDVGAWGKGFVMAISKRWKDPEREYRAWYKSQDSFVLGEVRLVQVEGDIWISPISSGSTRSTEMKTAMRLYAMKR